MGNFEVKSIAVVGAGAAGAITAATLKAENYFDRIRVFERRETPGGTWIYDADPSVATIQPGALPTEIDKPLVIPEDLPTTTTPNQQERYAHAHLSESPLMDGLNLWRLTLRKYDPLRRVDVWWQEDFDAVILANGHYAVPWVLVIGNSASGHDISVDLLQAVQLPLYQSRRSRGRLDGDEPPAGVEWKTVIKEYRLDGTIVFEDDSELADIDHVLYCTGYLPSYPFWNTQANGRPLFDYKKKKLINNYWHTFFQDIPNLAIVGMPRVLTFRASNTRP
ncbi:hypothetical protein SNK05_013569 [Fusarium graminearum]